MGLSGCHTPISRRMAREVLPPGACRDCVWLARHLAVMTDPACGVGNEYQVMRPGVVCHQCGIRHDPLAILAEYRNRGWIPEVAVDSHRAGPR